MAKNMNHTYGHAVGCLTVVLPVATQARTNRRLTPPCESFIKGHDKRSKGEWVAFVEGFGPIY